jgi:Protein of unknown function (DUF2865)
MLIRGKTAAIGCLSFGLLTLAAPASAQGIFESIFGGLRHAIEGRRQPTNITAFADPFASRINEPQRADIGPAKAFCVRISDGFYFPVQARPGMTAAQSCNVFCPSAKTALYSGSQIDSAVASDGNRYADLDNAFLYRKELVADSTCNGRDHFGLARLDVNNDPTLRPGDVVATKAGLMAYTGTKDKTADFTPIDNYRGLAKTSREKLADVKVMPTAQAAAEPAPPTVTHVSDRSRDNDRLRRSAEQVTGYFFP